MFVQSFIFSRSSTQRLVKIALCRARFSPTSYQPRQSPPVPAATTESSIIALSWSQENTNVNLCARNDHHLGLVRRRCPALISRLSSPAAQPLPLSSTVFHQPPRPISYLLALPFSRCSLGQHLSLAELWREALCCRCLRDRVINIIISLLVLYELFFLSLYRIIPALTVVMISTMHIVVIITNIAKIIIHGSFNLTNYFISRGAFPSPKNINRSITT